MDFSTSELPLTAEVSSALCPGFLGGKASPATLTIQLANGPNLITTVQHLRAHQPLGGWPASRSWPTGAERSEQRPMTT